MRITLVHYSFWPVVGGVEQIMLDHARLFLAAGHAVAVACLRGETPPDAPAIRLCPLPESPGELRAALADATHDADIVIAHNLCTMPFHLGLTEAFWSLAGEAPGKRFVAWTHDISAANPDLAQLGAAEPGWQLLQKSHSRFEYVAVSDLRAHQLVEHLGLAPEAIAQVPNGISLEGTLSLSPRIAELSTRFRLLERDAILLQPARLLRRKNVEFSLELLAALRRARRDAVLIVTGPPDPHNPASAAYAESLAALRRSLDLEECALFLGEAGPVSPTDLASLYRVSDGLLFPSRQEGFGLPMLEAALHRLPAFCADLPPQNRLPGALCFPANCEATEAAAFIMRQIDNSATIQARKKAARIYSWPAIWRNCLAPFLAKNPFSPT